MEKEEQVYRLAYWLAAGLAVLLCGCGATVEKASPAPTPTLTPEVTVTPTPEPTPMPDGTVVLDGKEYHYNPDSASHDTYEINVGDGEHIFRLEAVSEGKWSETRDYTLSFYEREKEKPCQVIVTDIVVWPQYFDFRIEDIDFDGCMDFYYLWSEGTHNRYYSYYVWDKETEQFIYDPYGLGELENPTFDPEQKAVVSWYRTSIWGGKQSYYRYMDGQLTCVRVCGYPYEHEPESASLYVKDLVDGELKTVFEVTRASDTEFTEAEEEEYSSWHDLDYHGPHTLALDIGDGEHSFWVEITPRESEEEGIPITVSVYDSEEKNTLWQSWEDVCRLYEFEHISVESRDLDFDGDMDLEYSSWLSARMAGRAYWVWDAQQEKFVRDPYGLEELPWPEFDPEKQLVTAWYNESGGTGDFYYCYLDGTLTCIRRLYRDVLSVGEWKVVGIVEDYQNGELKEVYREEFADQGEAWPHTEEFDRWYDLDYHGEGTP